MTKDAGPTIDAYMTVRTASVLHHHEVCATEVMRLYILLDLFETNNNNNTNING